jgi:hypothetical protein
MIEVKETVEERRNRKSKAADENRNINNRLVGVLCRDSDPRQIRQEQSSFGGRTPTETRWRRSDSETTDMWLPAKGNWLLGSMGGMVAADELWVFRLGAISILLASGAKAISQESREGLDVEKQN